MGDVVVGLAFAGLKNGTYELITYAWTPGLPIDETLVIISSDHGEYLDTHGMWSHRLVKVFVAPA